MIEKLIKKGLVIGIVLFFIGASFIPNISCGLKIKNDKNIKNFFNENYVEIDYLSMFAANSPYIYDDILDQYQNITEEYSRIPFGVITSDNLVIAAQSFRPSLSILTKVDLLFYKASSSNGVTVSIKDSLDSGDALMSTFKSNSEINNYPAWTTFDFEDINVNPGQEYFIMCSTDATVVVEIYSWHYATINNTDVDNYDKGVLYFFIENEWDVNDNTDFCFKTYGIKKPPIAQFQWSPENPHMNQQIIFDASDSYDPDGNIVLYQWDWDNDGTYDESNSGPNATYSWSGLGNYPVTLRVIDNENKTDTVTKIVKITDITVPDDFDTIQEAIDNSETGYNITVREGTYEENLIIDVPLLSIQTESKAETIIDGGGKDHVIKVIDSAYGVDISGFTIQNSGQANSGIYLESGYNTIRNNKLIDNGAGLRFFESNGNIIFNNNFDDDYLGIQIGDSSHGNDITNNIIDGNSDHGMLIDETCTMNTISENTFSNNGEAGIKIKGTSIGNTIIYNDFDKNKYGINCSGFSDSSLFHHNSFTDNNIHNAWDSSTDRWDDGAQGNFWDDYTGTGPYYIPGGDNVDRYPLTSPPHNIDNLLLKSYNLDEYLSNENELKKFYNTLPSDFDTIEVPGDYDTIQEAVLNSNPGDKIIVHPGEYPEHIVVDKSLVIAGDNRETCIVDGNNEEANIFSITADNVEISGFTIQNSPIGLAGIITRFNDAKIHDNIFKFCGTGVELNSNTSKIYGISVYNNIISDNNWGIYIYDTSDCNIYNNDVKNNNYGIKIRYSSIEIHNNEIQYNLNTGLFQKDSDEVMIKENNVFFNCDSANEDTAGIWIKKSNECEYIDNVIFNNKNDGILLWGSSNNLLSGNEFNNNHLFPLNLIYDNSYNIIENTNIVTEYETGINFRFSSENIIKNNEIKNNANNHCIILQSSDNNEFCENTFSHGSLKNYQNAGGFKIYESSDNNLCCHNNFYGDCDAIDECGNIWDDALFCGNYWENYNGQDTDGNGIGDVHYDIFGGSIDNYPLMFPWAPPNKPNKPAGETNCKKGQDYQYSTSSIDPNNLKIRYGWDWDGDHIIETDWTGYFNSNSQAKISNKWDKIGTYQISVIAQNEHGQVSDWSDSIDVSVPRYKIFACSFNQLSKLLILIFSILELLK
jgi:parallel beta-helix repeat protein